MGYAAMLDRTAALYRVTQPEDTNGTPGAATLTLVARLSCALSRQNITMVQGAPQAATGKSFRLYFAPGAPVREGDITEIAGYGKFRLSAPYSPRGHHIEADGAWEGEA